LKNPETKFAIIEVQTKPV